MEYKDKQIQIIETAERLFAQKGFAGTSVRDIAEEAGVNLAMISYYFGSKEKLMEALFEHRSVNIRMQVDKLLKDQSLSPFDRINILVDDFIERSFQREPFYKIMTCELLMEKNQFILDLLTDVKVRNAQIVSELIKDGQDKGVFKKDADVIFLLNTMSGTITHMLISRRYYKEYNNLQNMPDEQFQQEFKQSVSTYIKSLFKAMLVYEA